MNSQTHRNGLFKAGWQKSWLGIQDANGRSRAELLINTCAEVASTELGSLFVLMFFFSIFVHERAGFHATSWVKRWESECYSRLALTRKLRHATVSLSLSYLDFDGDLQSCSNSSTYKAHPLWCLKIFAVKCGVRQHSSLIVVHSRQRNFPTAIVLGFPSACPRQFWFG